MTRPLQHIAAAVPKLQGATSRRYPKDVNSAPIHVRSPLFQCLRTFCFSYKVASTSPMTLRCLDDSLTTNFILIQHPIAILPHFERSPRPQIASFVIPSVILAGFKFHACCLPQESAPTLFLSSIGPASRTRCASCCLLSRCLIFRSRCPAFSKSRPCQKRPLSIQALPATS